MDVYRHVLIFSSSGLKWRLCSLLPWWFIACEHHDAFPFKISLHHAHTHSTELLDKLFSEPMNKMKSNLPSRTGPCCYCLYVFISRWLSCLVSRSQRLSKGNLVMMTPLWSNLHCGIFFLHPTVRWQCQSCDSRCLKLQQYNWLSQVYIVRNLLSCVRILWSLILSVFLGEDVYCCS